MLGDIGISTLYLPIGKPQESSTCPTRSLYKPKSTINRRSMMAPNPHAAIHILMNFVDIYHDLG